MKKGECESFDKKRPETTLKKNMKGDNTEFSQKNKMNKVVYEQKLPRNTLSPFFSRPPENLKKVLFVPRRSMRRVPTS